MRKLLTTNTKKTTPRPGIYKSRTAFVYRRRVRHVPLKKWETFNIVNYKKRKNDIIDNVIHKEITSRWMVRTMIVLRSPALRRRCVHINNNIKKL